MFSFLKKELSFKEYLNATPNTTGYEIKKVQRKMLNKLIDTFESIPRNRKTLEYEVLILNHMSIGEDTTFDKMTLTKIESLLKNGGNIINEYISNLIYNISKEMCEADDVRYDFVTYVNDEILYLEEQINLMKEA